MCVWESLDSDGLPSQKRNNVVYSGIREANMLTVKIQEDNIARASRFRLQMHLKGQPLHYPPVFSKYRQGIIRPGIAICPFCAHYVFRPLTAAPGKAEGNSRAPGPSALLKSMTSE